MNAWTLLCENKEGVCERLVIVPSQTTMVGQMRTDARDKEVLFLQPMA